MTEGGDLRAVDTTAEDQGEETAPNHLGGLLATGDIGGSEAPVGQSG